VWVWVVWCLQLLRCVLGWFLISGWFLMFSGCGMFGFFVTSMLDSWVVGVGYVEVFWLWGEFG
jgi:hypothetical protein